MMACGDIERLVHPFLDGELLGDDCALVEEHLVGCARCRELVSFQSRFKADLRARLRAPVQAPAHLLASVRGALDRADAAGRSWPKQLRRVLPLGAGALAAAIALVLVLGRSSQPAYADDAIVEEAIRGHEKNLPVEVGGPNVSDEEIRSWMQGKVPVPVRPLRVRTTFIAAGPGGGNGGNGSNLVPVPPVLMGGRVYHLRNRDVGQLVYRVGRSQMTVYVFDPSGWEPGDGAPQAKTRRVGDHEVYVTEERGYTVALYRDRGVGYAVASDLEPEGVMRVVAASLNE